MNIKLRLTLLNFFQFFTWGAWLITFGNYWIGNKQWDLTTFGEVFGTMGIASILMPTLSGIIADRWMNAERLYGILQILYACTLFYLPQVNTPDGFFWIMLIAMCFYMPTIALSNSISYTVLKNNNKDVVKDFPSIRVWGTIGFITAMWITNLSGSKSNEYQFYIAGTSALCLGLYAFLLPKCPPQKLQNKNANLFQILGLDAFKLFANYKIALFFIFSMFLGGALQLTNAYGDVFLDEFKYFPKFAESFVVRYSTIILSISQVSETLFILAIPFFLRKYGIKKVMLISMLAWVLRFGLLGLGNPTSGLWMIILSCIIYGMAFDFFNISGSLFIETNTDAKIRSSAQGLFMMMTNGFGAVLGSFTSGRLSDKFFTHSYTNAADLSGYLETSIDNKYFIRILSEKKIDILANGMLSRPIVVHEWTGIWIAFALYALVIAVLFAVFFRHKHKPEDVMAVGH
ncbi:MFS transporter [Elizabethkingia argentiflava]|uniref:MFS transporter n=1 Tax=Elizabethkingia argenteiflava TaxID=2681556 RepID=A0A845PS15_9FLAO|nr:nucleoside permease [Elizabethkingia argenteiflava]NAW51002.1 MFS transporter [Elizabethkingia argenteiflava]